MNNFSSTYRSSVKNFILTLPALIIVCVLGISTGASSLHAGASLNYTFNADGVLKEAQSNGHSTSPYFWLNSGGELHIDHGVGSTAIGPLAVNSPLQELYREMNPLDTGNGYYPQNIFRLVTKSKWDDVLQEVRFRIDAINLTNTPNRDGYSGIFLMSHYRDQYNLYYAGIRMDGSAVIKKKKGGTYTTLAQKNDVFSGTYHKTSNPNLIPEDRWMKLKSETKSVTDGTQITLWLDRNNGSAWEKLLSVVDSSNPVTGPANAGIRTDYMDVYFDNYKLIEN